MKREAPLLVAFAIILLSAAPAVAATKVPWLEFDDSLGQSALLRPGDLELAEARRKELAGQGHPYVYGVTRTQLYLHRNGTISNRAVEIRHFLSDQGVQSSGDAELTVLTSHEVARIDAAFARSPQGTVVPLDPSTVRTVPDTDQRRVFSDLYRAVFPFADLRVGGTTVLVSERTFRADDWPLPWSGIWLLQSIVPIEQAEWTIEWDDGLPEPVWKSDSDELKCNREAARRVTCRIERSPAFVIDPQLTSFLDLIPQFVVALPATWPELAAEVEELIARQMAEEGAVAETARTLTRNSASLNDRIGRLHRFVADDVRYVALHEGVGTVVPHPPDVTLQRRYGDCKDKVTLFLALARASGIAAHPVLVATGRYRSDRLILPSGAYFDHMIVCLDEPSADFCIDLTELHAPTGEMPLELQGAAALDLRSATTGPRTLPKASYGTKVLTDLIYTVACDGNVQEELTRRYSGPAAISLRRGLASLGPDLRTRSFEQEYREVVSRTATPKIEVTGIDSAGDSVSLRSSTSFPGTGSFEQATLYADWDLWTIHYGVALKGLNRYHPYRHFGLLFETNAKYVLCSSLRSSFLGAELDFQSRFGRLTRTYDRTDGAIVVHTTLDLPRAEFSLQEQEQFNVFLERSLEQSRVVFGLQRN